MPDLCCIVTWRLVESVGRVFDPLLSSAIAVFEQCGCVDSYGHATSLIWMQQSLGVTVCLLQEKQFHILSSNVVKIKKVVF